MEIKTNIEPLKQLTEQDWKEVFLSSSESINVLERAYEKFYKEIRRQESNNDYLTSFLSIWKWKYV